MSVATTELNIWMALKDHANTFTGIPFVAYPSDAFTPPTDAKGLSGVYWIYDDLRFDFARRYVDTSGNEEHRGEFQVHVMMPLRFNYEALRQMAGQVVDHFAKDSRLSYGSTVVHIVDTPKTIGASYRDGAYNRLPVVVRWRSNG